MTTNDATRSRQLVVADSSSEDSLLNRTNDISQNFSQPKIRVLIVDDLRLVCEGLQAIFADDQNIEIVGFALNGQDAIEQVSKIKPDVVVLDLLMPVMGGIEATKKITQQDPNVKILILSSSEDDSIILEVIAAGANGYVLKSMVINELALAIRSVYGGSYHFAPGLLDNLAKIAAQNSNSNSPPKSLNFTPQEGSTINPVAPQPQVAKATAKIRQTKPKKPKKLLLPYADWAIAVSGIIILFQINSMGQDLGHIGLFLLAIALIADPVRVWWDMLWRYRRGIGIIAFAGVLGHVIYATKNFLEGNWATISLMSTQNKWGMWAGIIALGMTALMIVTSFGFIQRKLGKAYRQIHLLGVPVMALAILHTILVGPHYLMPDARVETVDYLRTFGLIAVGISIYLLKQRLVWSKLKLNNLRQLIKNWIKVKA